VFPVDNEAKPFTPTPAKTSGPAVRMQLRACEWRFLKREFPHGFDFDGSSHELKIALGLCVYLVAANRSCRMADTPHQAASARVAALVGEIARHPDYQRLRAEMLFIVEARTAIGPLRFRRTQCAVCARLKAGGLTVEKATGDGAG